MTDETDASRDEDVDDDFEDDGDDGEFEDADDDDDDFEDDDANRIRGARAIAVAEHVTRALAEDSDAIEIEVDERRGGDVELLVHANPDDMGRLIGRRGRVIQALRQLVRAAGSADGVRANIDVVE